MKIVCESCKTEYNLGKRPTGLVRCAVCGHTWVPKRSFGQNSLLKLLAAICALVAACVFSVVVIINHQAGSEKHKPIIARINKDGMHVVVNENGDKFVHVLGSVSNQSNDIYGIPNIVIKSYDVHGDQIAMQSFIPPATLIEPGKTIEFDYVLSVDYNSIKKATVELKGM